MKINISKEGIIEYYSNRIGYIKNNLAVVDVMFKKNEVEDYLTEKNGIPIEWRDNIYSALISGNRLEDTVLARNCRIYQLKPETDVCMKFIGYDELKHKGYGEPNISNYNKVFDGNVGTEVLDDIFVYFQNVSDKDDFDGHRMMISDVIEIYDDLSSEFYYVDKHNMVRLSGFEPQISPVREESQKSEKVIEEPEKMVFEEVTDTKTEVESVAEIKTAESDTQTDIRQEEPSCEPEEFRVETFTITM